MSKMYSFCSWKVMQFFTSSIPFANSLIDLPILKHTLFHLRILLNRYSRENTMKYSLYILFLLRLLSLNIFPIYRLQLSQTQLNSIRWLSSVISDMHFFEIPEISSVRSLVNNGTKVECFSFHNFHRMFFIFCSLFGIKHKAFSSFSLYYKIIPRNRFFAKNSTI